MKLLRSLPGTTLLLGTFICATAVWAAESQPGSKTATVKAYPLKTCLVSGEKFGGDMGEPYVFTNQGWQIKLCCKGCLKDFKKDTPKYMKKLEAAEQKAK